MEHLVAPREGERPPKRDTIRDALGGRRNSFGVIRLVLASAVIFSHTFYLGGWGADPVLAWTRGQDSIGGIAVVGFFAASGYLITRSGMRTDVVAFLWHRVLRIFPAFWLVLLVAAFIVGPLAWFAVRRSLDGYFGFGPDGPFAYIIENAALSMGQYGIYDVFAATTPYGLTAGSVLNGSLWTLVHEFFCYLVIGALVLVGALSRPRLARIVVPVIAAGAGAIQIGIVFFGINLGSAVPFLGDPLRSRLLWVFMVGACIAVFADRVPRDWRLAVLSGIVVVASLVFGGFAVFGLPATAYLVLWTAASLPPAFHWIGSRNDYSYGVYVYGFLVQQGLAFLGAYRWGYVPFVGITIVITAGCAWLSWHLVEKRALRLKDRGPGRGVAALTADVRRWRSRRGETSPAGTRVVDG